VPKAARGLALALDIMIARHKIIYCVLALYCVITTAFVAYQSASLQLASMIALVALGCAVVASIVALILDWKDLRIVAAIPLACCALATIVPSYAGDFGRELLFAKHLSYYEGIVRKAETELGPGNAKTLSVALTESDKKYTYFVLAERDGHGNLIVEIATEGGFPVKHSGYVYSASGTLSETKIGRRWSHQQQVKPQWFRVMN
jgi:hypothetical protein